MSIRRIIAIDGGGMRGFIPACILADWEQRIGRRLWQQADMFYGVSIGGILAFLAASGGSMEDARSFFTEDGPKIFAKDFHYWSSMGGLIRPRYSATPIEEALQRRFAGKRMRDCLKPAGAYALDVQSGDPVFFRSNKVADQDNHFLWQASRATSAAQTYFPSFNLRGRELWDGGNVDNNPSEFALADARSIFPGETIRVLSLGCGMDSGPVNSNSLKFAGLLRAGLATVSLMFEADSTATDVLMMQQLGENYVRLQPKLSKPLALDGAGVDDIAWLEANAADAVKQARPLLERFFG